MSQGVSSGSYLDTDAQGAKCQHLEVARVLARRLRTA